MIDNDTTRLSRLTAILILLLSSRSVQAGSIAGKFDISLRTVYRDIRALEEAGVPIFSEPGKGYRLADGYKLPPVMFTTEEAISFLTAEKFIQKLADKYTSVAHESALSKIRSVLRSSEKESLDNLADNIEVLRNPWLPARSDENGAMRDILHSIAAKTAIAIDYERVHTAEKSTRTVEPVGIYFAASRWHLIGYCLLRQDYRNFRVDKILNLRRTAQPIRNNHPTLKTYLSQLTAEERDLQTVRISIRKDHLHYIGEQKYYMGYVQERAVGEHVEMTFLTGCPENFARAYLVFGDFAKVLEPEFLKAIIREVGERVLKNI